MRPTSATESSAHPFVAAQPPHTQTESTLAPTSEFVRYLLLALPSRYVGRGIFGTMFEDKQHFKNPQNFLDRIFGRVERALQAPGNALQKQFPNTTKENKDGIFYNTALGLGSIWLTLSYSNMVYRDIRNLFSEAVGDELGKPHDQVKFDDLRHSKNRIVQKTLDNYRGKMWGRLAIDFLFFPAALMRSTHLGDLVLGLKGVQALLDTWKRKTTLFEDLVTFVNNKIQPRNGLGQPITQGEVFDLYQHYTEQFHPEKMFRNVIDNSPQESATWALSQPVFARIAELMNLSYAYKHTTSFDADGQAVKQADFALPKFIYLLGHDLIQPRHPERTLTLVEIANAHGIPALKDAVAQLEAGATVEQITQKYGVTLNLPRNLPQTDEKNGVIVKGSSMQLDAAPVAKIDGNSIAHTAPQAALAIQ